MTRMTPSRWAATAVLTTLAAALALGTANIANAVPEGAGPTAPPVAVSDAQGDYLARQAELSATPQEEYLAVLAAHFGYGPDADTSEPNAYQAGAAPIVLPDAEPVVAQSDNQARDIVPVVLAATVINEFGSLTQIDGDLFRGDNATGAGVEAPVHIPQFPSAN